MHNLGSCVLHLHIENKAFPTIFEVTNMTGPIMLGRMQAKAMGYAKFPQIEWPHAFKMCTISLKKICTDKTHLSKTISNSKSAPMSSSICKTIHVYKCESSNATQAKQSKQTDELVVPKINWNTDHIELNGKVHRLPITEDYILKEYKDVSTGVGTLPRGPYHIRFKEDYKPVKLSPWSVPVAIQTVYKAELNRLVQEGIITEVNELTEWINSIIPVMKSNGSLRLCGPKQSN